MTPVLIVVLQKNTIEQYTRYAKGAETSGPAIWQREWAVHLRNRGLSFRKSSFGMYKKRHTESGIRAFRGCSLLLFCSNGFVTPFCIHIWSHCPLKHIISVRRWWEARWMALWALPSMPLPFWVMSGTYFFKGWNSLGRTAGPSPHYSLYIFL